MIRYTRFSLLEENELVSHSLRKRMERAISLANVSDMRQKHGAILYQGGRVISIGVNTWRNAPVVHMPYDAISNHAEINCLKGLSSVGRQGVLYVARISSGGNVAFSKPCAACRKYLENFTHIREVIHT